MESDTSSDESRVSDQDDEQAEVDKRYVKKREEEVEKRGEDHYQVSDEEVNRRERKRMKIRAIAESEDQHTDDEGRVAKQLQNPRNPTKQEVELHDLTHRPFR